LQKYKIKKKHKLTRDMSLTSLVFFKKKT